jgi:hypothetical protein
MARSRLLKRAITKSMTNQNQNSLANLVKPTVAADGAKNLRGISVMLPEDMISRLKTLGGDRSTKIRAAIAEWLEKHNA